MKKILLGSLIIATSLFSQEISYDLKPGWNLIGATENISPSAFDNSSCVDVIWGYKNGNWNLHLTQNVNHIMPNGVGYLNNIEKRDGFWVRNMNDSNCVVNITVDDTNDSLTNDDNNISSILVSADELSHNDDYNYKSFKLVYKTKDTNGDIILVSALLTIPDSNTNSSPKAMIEDNHGTMFSNAKAPSNSLNYKLANKISGENDYIGLFPDYIGYGNSSDKSHPYLIEKTSAQTSLDAIKAAVEYIENSNIPFNHKLFLSGYSEGGYVTMALAKKIEEENLTQDAPVNLIAVAPMAGPYNIEALANTALNANYKMPHPAILGFIAQSYSETYNDVNLDSILNSNVTENKVNRIYTNLNYDEFGFNLNRDLLNLTTVNIGGLNLPDLGILDHNSSELFNTNFLTNYQTNSNNTLRIRFQENAVDNWSPTVDMNLIQCIDDDVVDYSMSQNAYNKFIENNSTATITLTPLTSSVDLTHPSHHLNCEPQAYDKALEWFNSKQ